MKIIRLALFFLIITVSLVAFKCKDKGPAATNASLIRGTWTLTAVAKNGTAQTLSNYSGFSLVFTVDGDNKPSTYTITTVAANANGATPNHKKDSPNTGLWTIIPVEKTASPTQITFGTSSTSPSTVNVIGTTTETSLVLEWTVDATVDKTTPTYRFTLTKTK